VKSSSSPPSGAEGENSGSGAPYLPFAFEVTLMIGLFANLFTAVFVSRTIFDWELGMQKRVVTLSI